MKFSIFKIMAVSIIFSAQLFSNEIEPAKSKEFPFRAHKKNYLLFYAYDFKEHDDRDYHEEAKYQLSFKLPVGSDIYAAYTQKAFWQVYDFDDTRPFREIDHNPELYYEHHVTTEKNPFDIKSMRLGYEHDSNGEGIEEKSRSWNRMYLWSFWDFENIDIDFKLWQWLKKPPKKKELDPKGEESPAIENYFGNGELNLNYREDGYLLSVMLRNNLNPDINRGALQAELVYHLKSVDLFFQYFNGYGESVGDYDALADRVGLGVVFTY